MRKRQARAIRRCRSATSATRTDLGDTVQPVFLIMASVALGVAGQLILKAALGRGGDPGIPAAGPVAMMRRVVTNPSIWAGLAGYRARKFFLLVAFSPGEHGYAHPLFSLDHAFLLLASWV